MESALNSDDVLKRLATEALLLSCLKFPLCRRYMLNSVQKAFSFRLENFNGLQELFKRPDAAATMLTLQRLQTADAERKQT